MVPSDSQQFQDGMGSESDTVDQLKPVSDPPRVTIACHAASHQGRVRTNNEDQFHVSRLAKSMKVLQTSLDHVGETRFSEEDGYLMVVADGMGGAAAGERASAVAVETVESFALNTLKWFLNLGKADESELVAELRHGLEIADKAVVAEAEADYRLHGMGTTLTMAYSMGRCLYIVHAGDSRAYLFRRGELEQVTSDHTLVQVLVAGGVISPEAAKTHARRNVVTNVIGGPNAGVHAEIHKVRIEHGDVLLLCSDGLTEPVEDDLIARTLAEVPDPKAASERLIALALENGGPDNVTVLVAKYAIGGEAHAGSTHR